MSRLIPVNRYGKVEEWAIVDDQDYALLSSYAWRIKSDKTNKYAITGSNSRAMHNLIMKPPKGLYVDHINMDGCDNRGSNLRLVTRTQNQQHRRGWNKSGFKGIRFNKRTGKYLANINLGSFDSCEEAAHAYDRAATLIFGDYAVLNFPPLQTGESPDEIRSRLLGEVAEEIE